MSPINTDSAPKAIGPYSQGIVFQDLLFLSGQVAINPVSGNIEASGIEGQTEQVMKNLQSVLKAGGSDFSKVVKCTVFLQDMEDFATFNKVYGSFFGPVPPARSTVQVAKLPKGAKVEIDVIAHK